MTYFVVLKDLKGGNYDPLTAAAAAAALNGVSPNFLQYFSPLAAAAAAASSSSPSPSPTSNIGQQQQQQQQQGVSSNSNQLIGNAGPQSAAAALSALMDPLGQLSKSAQAQLAAAAVAQQQSFLNSNDVKTEGHN